METKLSQEQLVYLHDEEFYNDYFELLISRITHSSMSLEKDLGNPDDHKNAVKFKNNMHAFKKLLRNLQTPLTESLIIDVANTINKDSKYISDGYRKIGDILAGTNIPISLSSEIEKDMQELLRKYYYDWNDLDVLEREARFHIEFIRIHPFEDGNGRTSRLLLNFNIIVVLNFMTD